jgi:low temperature requirement protein LtrA
MRGGEIQYWLWGLAVLFDVIAAAVGGREEGWNLHPEHFAERHGLFVIIALGETLIVAANGLADASWTRDSMGVAVLAVATTCGLWWTYFPKSKPALEHAMALRHGSERSMLARDVYSLLHFPMVCGVIAFATATEIVAAHPSEPLAFGGRLTLASGLLLFLGGMAPAMWRATCGRLLPRVALTMITAAAVMAVEAVPPIVTLVIAFAGVAAVAGVEQRATEPNHESPLS